MLSRYTEGWTARGLGVALAVGLGVVGLVAVAAWIGAAPPHSVVSPPSDLMEQALDNHIGASMRDFQVWNRINIAVQSATILLGLAATLLTASTTADNTQRLKTPTVTVTALTAALVGVQSTFHLRENIHTDVAAFTKLVALESNYIFQRDRLPGEGPERAALRRNTVRRLTQISVERMTALANIGGAGPEPAQGDAKGDGAE
ncbi:hypothetical protein [Lichenibacterium dinghuense]|uniref:hypothetical protein n=1 Tax=Lichenibacterium dinghuense TaxID=2895977 RepID=UPI001F26A953|nr:hypothetical protein [Lichenibacterium sp. 6Y81]